MTVMKKDVWIRLRDYHFDNLVPPHLTDRVAAMFGGVDAPTQAFASKLARKHGWTPRFARHAVNEYKKFVYLGVTSTVPVTPSKVIDVVWHEHLLFSRPYREFCDHVLERPFDHNPELIPADDQTDVFNFQFEATLDAYEREFNATPPADVWGKTKFDRPSMRRQRTEIDQSATQRATGDSDAPLYTMFDSHGAHGVDSGGFHYGDGGGFSGGGGGHDWGGASTDTDSSATGTDGGGSTDSGDSGGSSCSSSSCGGSSCNS